MTSRRHKHKKVGAFAVAVVITLVLGACAGDDAGASQGTTKLANPTTGPAETGPAETPASAAPDVVRQQGTCSGGARSHLELTRVDGRIEARFVLHQMTVPGHLWRVVLKYADATECCAPPDAGDFRVFFEGTRLATGSSGDITVRRSVRNAGYGVISRFGVVTTKARDRQTGQFCRVARLGI